MSHRRRYHGPVIGGADHTSNGAESGSHSRVNPGQKPRAARDSRIDALISRAALRSRFSRDQNISNLRRCVQHEISLEHHTQQQQQQQRENPIMMNPESDDYSCGLDVISDDDLYQLACEVMEESK
eukprot:CAMPEP_0182445430 /NCGR_PEP_ID=MMETSP1172-20130603/3555_1 /TAXON_ID=708627 /ORGANISM="Timspurckia oligopyrenoides, Strain CCMP3278" /LENGTH=125 /DNA_ID=CAMNT_0024641203 /DNA_START=36 /DNA_END=410 /DNA_ORIENTATION=+